MENKKCPKCGAVESVKSGMAKGRQRYKCKGCGYHYTVMKLGKALEKAYVIRALQLYLEGMGFRGIERVMGISHVTVIYWVRKYGKDLSIIRKQDGACAEVEVDELHSYVGEKKTKYGSGVLLEGATKKCWIVPLAVEEPPRAAHSLKD